jgi:hypothetical protein
MDGVVKTEFQIDLIDSERGDQRYSLRGLIRQAWDIQGEA